LKKYLEILKKCPLFCEIGEENLLRMLSCLGARILTFEKRETVFAEGERARYIGLVLSGEVQVEQVDYYGNRSIFSNLQAGEVFGEACTLLQRTVHASPENSAHFSREPWRVLQRTFQGQETDIENLMFCC
jgi:CRP-like cAMP-binding protein